MQENSIDAIVSDPPYGLSNNAGDSVGKIYTEIVFPYLADFYSKRFCNGELPFPPDSISLLDFVNRSIGIESGVGVPKGSIDLNGQIPIWKKEVETTSKPSSTTTDTMLSNKDFTFGPHVFPNFILQPRPNPDSTLSDCLRGCYREPDLGCISVTVVVPFDSGFARFLSTLNPSCASFLGDLVRAQNNAPGEPNPSSFVVAGNRAEFMAVLRFDFRRGTLEILPTDRTLFSQPLCEIIPTALVGASARTSGLPPKFESVGFSVVGNATNETVCFDFHTDILSYLRKNRNGFMGKGWDHGVPGAEFWAEALRVAKPGAYLLAFGGTRTFHRLTVAIEDAGWEIRDCIMWVYSSGFPKSHDVSKSFDRSSGALKPEGKGFTVAGYSHNDKLLTTAPSHGYVPPQPTTEAAKQWEGWGTALKPAWEPIIVARKPLIGTIAENVEQFGVGGINIDGCRVGISGARNNGRQAGSNGIYGEIGSTEPVDYGKGRWPANLIHDGSSEVVGLFPDVDGTFGMKKVEGGHRFIMGDTTTVQKFDRGFMDSGSAARFFYCAKASQRDRNDGCELLTPKRESDRVLEDGVGGDNPRNRTNNARQNHHPCVKPTDLMRYLCRLVTPPGGIVLDPFMGSGSTGKGAVSEGFSFVGCELDPDYVEIARARIAHVGGAEEDMPVKQEAKQEGPVQLGLFGGGQ